MPSSRITGDLAMTDHELSAQYWNRMQLATPVLSYAPPIIVEDREDPIDDFIERRRSLDPSYVCLDRVAKFLEALEFRRLGTLLYEDLIAEFF